jgi:dihydropteroate synthase
MTETIKSKRFVLNVRNELFDLSQRTFIIGILNVTPDSFFDGGKFFDVDKAVERGIKMAEQGADIIDIGGESTRPGSEPISLEEELSRVIPVIERLSQEIKTPLSIDTYKSIVAKKALDSGASMINDISALRFDPEMKKIAAEYTVPVILMHIKGTPKNMQDDPYYDDVMKEISFYLKESITIAKDAGIKEDKIIIDPGIGFGKRLQDNLDILKNLSMLKSLGKPILVGPSRKSFIGKVLDLPPEERLEGSLGALAVAILNGANLVRVHDVKENLRVAKLVDAIKRG